jgi:hypothetical protein
MMCNFPSNIFAVSSFCVQLFVQQQEVYFPFIEAHEAERDGANEVDIE